MNTPTPMPTGEPEFLDEDTYDARYQPVAHDYDSSLWDAADLSDDLPERHIWSVLEVDGRLYVVPGRHRVNVVGFNVTTHPWENDNIEVAIDAVDTLD